MNQSLIFTSFIISTISDIFIAVAIFILFVKIVRTKTIAVENNHEIFEHDKMIIDLQEKVEEINHR